MWFQQSSYSCQHTYMHKQTKNREKKKTQFLMEVVFLLIFYFVFMNVQYVSFWENFNFVGSGSSRSRKKQGEDVMQTLKVSLEELYNSTTKKLSLSKNILCQKCKGYFQISSYIAFSLILGSLQLPNGWLFLFTFIVLQRYLFIFI